MERTHVFVVRHVATVAIGLVVEGAEQAAPDQKRGFLLQESEGSREVPVLQNELRQRALLGDEARARPSPLSYELVPNDRSA